MPSDSSVLIPWSDIGYVGAFRRGEGDAAFTCLWIRTPRLEFPVEFDARNPRWEQLLAGLTRHLPGLRPLEKWFPPPLHLVLEINLQNVYERTA